MLDQLADDLASGRTTARALVGGCLDRIADPAGEGGRAFVRTDPDLALAEADHADRMRAAGAAPRFAGIPISVKDLFDVAGQVTKAGTRFLAGTAPARADAPAIARLRAAGFVVVGRTNMTELAFSGLGLNPHYGTPANPFDRATGRIPGGSSAGAAVSITDRMAFGAIGTDTGGSCRIPAALCGIVGFKPTARRVPTAGAVPLSTTLDSVGPLANCVRDVAILDAIMAGEATAARAVPPVRGLRLAVPRDVVLDGMDAAVEAGFARALDRLGAAGALVSYVSMPHFAELAGINAKGGFSAAEAYHWNRPYIDTQADLYDPRVIVRIRRGAGQSAADYLDLLAARADAIARLDAATADWDALIMPTVPTIAPAIGDLDDDAEFARVNLLMLRNPTFANFFDRCALSIPVQEAGTAPVGLMLMGRTGDDARLLGIGAALEGMLSPPAR